METKRQQKVAKILQQELSDIFIKDGMKFLPNVFTTITKVKVTPDLSITRVLVSFLNCSNANEALLTLKKHSSEIRYLLGNKIRNQVRIIPQIEFYIDDTQEYVEKMDKLFNSIK